MFFNKLIGHIPQAVFTEIPVIVDKHNINTPIRLAHFLGQCSHESGNFRLTVENLNYSSDRLMVIFPKYFRGLSQAELATFHRSPERIANRVYASRMGNGNSASGDGWRFRGRGFIQLTGRNNYTLFDRTVADDIITNPDLVSTKYPLESAAWFWTTNNINVIADRGVTNDTVTLVTRRVNGGTIGLDHRIQEFNRFLRILTN